MGKKLKFDFDLCKHSHDVDCECVECNFECTYYAEEDDCLFLDSILD